MNPRDEATLTQECRRWRIAVVHAALATAVLLVYLPASGHRFLTYDDSLYVTANPHVQLPVTIEKVCWAFTTFHAANWHPLAWLSHMMDCALFGVDPRAHHMVNVIIHLANAALLLELLRRMSRQWPRSAVAAALFALHPLHVESVAWIAERKDVLCAFFFLLTLLAYHAYARKPSTRRYIMVTFLFALSLMAKPMAVTLPFVLLLLDYWPLRRWIEYRLDLLWEKTPLFAMSVVSCILTLAAQHHAGAIQSTENFPWTLRLANVLGAYLQYLFKTIWPVHLAAFYPHPAAMSGIRWPLVVAAIAVLSSLSACAWSFRRRAPYLLTGWCWFLGMLVPVIGLVQVGLQEMADRYTYLPLIGLFVAAVWAAADLASAIRIPTTAAAVLALGVTTACGVAASRQLEYWKDSVTLFAHAIHTTGPHELVRCALGIVHLKQKRFADAASQLEQALRLQPNDADTNIALGNVLNRLGSFTKAARHYRDALRISPDSAEAHAGLAAALLNQGDEQSARREIEEALRLDPRLPAAHVNYGLLLLKTGARDEAVPHFAEALRLDPKNEFAHINLGLALTSQGQYSEALPHFREAVQLAPENSEAHNNLGITLLNLGRIDEARAEFSETIARDGSHIGARLNIATIYLSEGKPDRAVETLREAARINPQDPRIRELMESAQRRLP